MKKLVVLMLALSLLATSVNAGVVASYDSGVAAAAGAGPSADPTTQGWTAFGMTNAWAYAADSGNGGWRITDGTSSAGAFYQAPLSAGAMSSDWTATWTVASNADLVNATTYLDNWISDNNKQINNAMWIEVAGAYRYILTVNDNAGVMQISDGTTAFDIAGHGYSQEDDPFNPGTSTTVMDFVTFTLSYDAGTGIATLSDGTTNYGAVTTSGSATKDRVVWGAISSGGTGSTTWNAVTVIPEPATMLLLGLGGLSLMRRRRKIA